jgi:hypothetical protein
MSGTEADRARPDRPGSRSFPLVMSAFIAILAIGVVSGIAIHRRFIGFERVVARHVPNDVTLAVRWDVEKVTLFEPTRRFLLPLLDETPTDDLDPGDRSRRRRLARKSGLEIGRDLREALALFGPGPNDWAVVAGGSFPKGGVADAIRNVLADEGRSMKRVGDERFEAPEGIAFGRAPDGVLVVASSRERLEAALPVRDATEAIPRSGAGAFVLRADASWLSSDGRAVFALLGDVSRVEGIASWGSPLVVDVTVHYLGRSPPDALARGRRALAVLFGSGSVPPTEVVSAAAGPSVTFRISLNDEALERAARRIGDSVYGTLWRNRRKTAAP